MRNLAPWLVRIYVLSAPEQWCFPDPPVIKKKSLSFTLIGGAFVVIMLVVERLLDEKTMQLAAVCDHEEQVGDEMFELAKRRTLFDRL